MRIFLAGATGVVGRNLMPVLVRAGHTVTGMTRSPQKIGEIEAAGAEGVVCDALDPSAVMRTVQRARTDVVIHQLTAIPSTLNLRSFEREFALTNRLRTEGTDNLLDAALSAGARAFVAQSYTGWPYARGGGAVKTEDDPLDPHPPAAMRASLDAIRHLESRVLRARGIVGTVLRYGGFYGPGTSISENSSVTKMIRQRSLPVVAGGTGVWSFIHVDDVAQATLTAVERAKSGLYNIVDDEPAPVAQWLPALAQALHAPPPRHVPVWLARLLIGEPGVVMMTEVRGASNAKAKRELGWTPLWPSWREGFVSGLAVRTPCAAEARRQFA